MSGLSPFLRPYRVQIVLAALFLVLAAVTTLVFPIALRSLIDGGLISTDKGAQTMALREHFGALFAVAVALGVFSAARFYTVSWLGERVTADLRNAVYAHVLRQSPAFFETTQTGEVLSRLTADTTLVQTVVGSSLSMGLRNAVMGVGALAMLVWTNPYVMVQVLGILVLVVLPSMWFGRRVRKLSRASQDRVADSSAIAAEVLNAIPGGAELHGRRRARPPASTRSTDSAFRTAVRRTQGALGAGGLHHHRHLGARCCGASTRARRRCCAATSRPATWARPWSTSIILASADRGARRGLRRPAARRRRHRAPDGTAACAGRRSCRRRARRSRRSPRPAARVRFEGVTFHYPSRPGTPALRDFSLDGRARRDRGAGRIERRGQEHGVPAAAALLRPAVGPHRCSTARRSRRSRCEACAPASAWCRRTR